MLAATNRHANIMRQALSSTLLSFAVLIAVSAVTMIVMRAGNPAFVHNPTVRRVQHPAAINLMISAGGAVAGVVMVAAGRFTQLARPLVALQLLPAAATLGGALELSDGALTARSLGRLAIDIAMVLLAAAGYLHLQALHRSRSRRIPH